MIKFDPGLQKLLYCNIKFHLTLNHRKLFNNQFDSETCSIINQNRIIKPQTKAVEAKSIHAQCHKRKLAFINITYIIQKTFIVDFFISI